MWKTKLIFSILFFITPNLYADKSDPFIKFCNEVGANFTKDLSCPNSKFKRKSLICLVSKEPLVYFNGCNLDVAGYGKVFFKACLRHDLCYHHEPATNGLSKETCDLDFYDDMKSICNAETNKDLKVCNSMAWSYYKAVQVGGDISFNCSNVRFDYSSFNYLLYLGLVSY